MLVPEVKHQILVQQPALLQHAQLAVILMLMKEVVSSALLERSPLLKALSVVMFALLAKVRMKTEQLVKHVELDTTLKKELAVLLVVLEINRP